MTARLLYGTSHRAGPATIATVIRAVLRRSDWRAAMLAALEAHPDFRCRGCEGYDDGSGRHVELRTGVHVWQTCQQCRTREANVAILEASIPAES